MPNVGFPVACVTAFTGLQTGDGVDAFKIDNSGEVRAALTGGEIFSPLGRLESTGEAAAGPCSVWTGTLRDAFRRSGPGLK